MSNKPFLYWLLIMCCLAFASIIGQHFDFWTMMDEKDETKIVWAICAITLISSLLIGRYAYIGHAKQYALNILWFISDAMITLGMIGTVAGFLIMMHGGFAQIDIADPGTIQGTIQTLGAGMGTILITTLMGLIASVLLKLQLVIIDEHSQG